MATSRPEQTALPKPFIPFTSSSRVFPLDSPYTAVSIEASGKDEDGTTYKYSLSLPEPTLENPGLLSSGMQTAHSSEFPPNVLPNGFYIYNGRYSVGGGPWQHAFYIGNLLVDHSSYTQLKQNLDPSRIAMLSATVEKKQLVAVSADAQELFLYVLVPSSEMIHAVTSRYGRKSTAYELENCFRGGPNGYSIAKFQNQIIHSIAGFPDLVIGPLAIALSSAEDPERSQVYLGFLGDDKQLKLAINCLPGSYSSSIQLLSSTQGHLIVHDSQNNTLTIIDVRTLPPSPIRHFPCPPKMYNLSVSTDGTSLTALDFQGGVESRLVHHFNLADGAYRPIHLKKPVADFVIGPKGKVCVACPGNAGEDNALSLLFGGSGAREFPGNIQDLLTEKKPEAAPVPAAAEADRTRPHFLSALVAKFSAITHIGSGDKDKRDKGTDPDPSQRKSPNP